MSQLLPGHLVPVLVLFLAAGPAFADVKLPALFSDHMVLQADVPAPVWGTAEPGEAVTVSISGQSKVATAGADGKWSVKLDPLVAGGPAELTVKGSPATGPGQGNTVVVHDVLVGEVWLCSGQSNMVLPVSKARDFALEQPAANWPALRTFDGRWVACSPETVGAFSATAYFFGREVHRKTGRPVGLVNRSAGGTRIELWTSWDAQKDVAELKPLFSASGQLQPARGKKVAQAEEDRKQAAEVEGRRAAADRKLLPGYLFEDRIAPLIPYALRGAIWYQGEANSYTEHAGLYGRQLAAMIADWRARWGSEFAFLSVQLPELGKPQAEPVEEHGRASVREGVLQSLALPNTGIAVTLGTGEERNNHPVNKQEVGRRLALWALATVYGQKDAPASGPLPSGHEVAGSRIIVKFRHADGGLVAKGGGLKGFAIAGKDRKWVWANAAIEGDTVAVSSPEVTEPVAVRYGWASNPAGANLTNGAGLPASPFRTDDWPPDGKVAR